PVDEDVAVEPGLAPLESGFALLRRQRRVEADEIGHGLERTRPGSIVRRQRHPDRLPVGLVFAELLRRFQIFARDMRGPTDDHPGMAGVELGVPLEPAGRDAGGDGLILAVHLPRGLQRAEYLRVAVVEYPGVASGRIGDIEIEVVGVVVEEVAHLPGEAESPALRVGQLFGDTAKILPRPVGGRAGFALLIEEARLSEPVLAIPDDE